MTDETFDNEVDNRTILADPLGRAVGRYLDENFHWCLECGAQVHNDHRNVHEVWHTKIEQQIRLGF